VAAVASLLDDVAALAEGRPDLRRDAEIFAVDPHSIPPHGVATLLKLGKFLLMALPAFFREDHGFCLKRRLVVRVAGDTVDPLFRMLRFSPGLEETGSSLLMAGDAVSDIDLLITGFFRRRAHGEGKAEDKETRKSVERFHSAASSMNRQVATKLLYQRNPGAQNVSTAR
jgi:hypothetical protein